MPLLLGSPLLLGLKGKKAKPCAVLGSDPTAPKTTGPNRSWRRTVARRTAVQPRRAASEFGRPMGLDHVAGQSQWDPILVGAFATHFS